MRKLKRLASLFLAVALVLTCVPHISLRASAATSGYYTYSVSGGEATITDVDTSISGRITVPSSLGGYPVTTIGTWAFSHCTSITAVTIGSNITTINQGAFSHCEKMTTVVIPDSVTSMGSQTFQYCYKLTSVTMGTGLSSIASYIFAYCTALVNIIIPKNVMSIGWCAFTGCTSLQGVTIPAGVLTVESQAFNGCSSLSKVYYGGTKAQRDSMSIALWNKPFENATWYYSAVCYHSYGSWVKYNDTYHKRTCTLCGNDVQTESHNWNSGVVTQAATCTKTGIRTYTCSTCGGTKTETIPTNSNHSYSSVVTPPTCTSQGYTTYTCTACGYNYKSNYVNAKSHTYGDWIKLDDSYHQRTCTVCKTHTETGVHDWDAGVVTEEPTCKEFGTKVYNCITCGATKTETLQRTEEHTYSKWEKIDDANHKRFCTVCLRVSETEIHVWNPGTVKTPATCTENEVRTYRCIYCQAEREAVIPDSAKGHDLGNWESLDDTYHRDACSECNFHTEPEKHSFNEEHTCTVCQKKVDTDHSWDDGEVTRKPTCIEDGILTYTCNICAATITESIPKITFADVITNSWQFTPAAYVYDRGLMAGKGTDANAKIIFDPNNSITREEFVQVLYNAEGKPSVSFVKNFPDVAANGWYRNAVMWANEQGIASGMGNGNFGVGKNITRQDLALMLMKYAKLKGCSLAAEEGRIDQFADGNKVAGYAKEAMDWAVTKGILSGKGEAGKPLSTFKLDPTGTATRAECAAMLKNFMTAFGL